MDVDVGHISPEDYREHSRRNFLKTAAAVTAALAAAGFGGVQLATREAQAQAGGEYTTYLGVDDAAILQLAYQLEILEGTFYAVGRDSGLFQGPALAQIAELSAHEFAHADVLAGALGALGVALPPTDQLVLPPTPDAATFLGLRRRWSRSVSGRTRGPRRPFRIRAFCRRRSPYTTPSASTGTRSRS